MIIEILGKILILMAAIILHEVAHGWTANRLGDPTAKEAGRLTLNPLKHVDLYGTILLPGALLVLRFLGYPTILLGWAKPVPVNFYRLSNPRQDMMVVGMAGPIVNILLAMGCGLLLKLELAPTVHELITYAIFINLLLATFNMIPIPPLDGSRLVMGLLPQPIAMWYGRLEPYGILIIIVLLSFNMLDAVVFPTVEFLAYQLGVR